MRVLVSGFEPFLEEKINPTELIANYVNSCDFKGGDFHSKVSHLDVRGVVLPVVFDEAFKRLESERRLFNPDVVLSFGLAGGRSRIEIEMLAVNYRGGDQTARGDNRGQVLNGPILRGTESAPMPSALPTTLPVQKILDALIEAEIPTGRSWSAGSYVCNDLFFQMQERLRFTRVRSGFIHVPRIDDGPFKWPRFESALIAILQSL